MDGRRRLRPAPKRFRSVRAPTELALARRSHPASLTIIGENLALFTSYSGLDPEVNFAGGAQSIRAEFFTLPPAKRVTGRLSISF